MRSRIVDRTQVRICCWLLCIFIVLGSLGVVAWLSLIPKNPSFRISDIKFPSPDSMNNSTNHNSTVANNSLLVDLEIYNPNKRMRIYYNGITLQLYRGGGGAVVGANSSTPGFYQGYKDTTSIQLAIHANQEFWQGMRGWTVDFMVRVETAVRFRIIKWKTKLRQMEYEAHFNDVKISLNGTVSGGNYGELQIAPMVKLSDRDV